MNSPRQTTPEAPTEAKRIVWPLRREPFVAAGWAIVVVAAAILGTWLSGDVLTSAFVSLLLLIALWRVWAPVTLHFGPRGVIEETLGSSWRINWRDIARYEFRNEGLWLYSSPEESPLAPMKSLYAPWGGQREQLESVVEYYMAAVEEEAIE